ncbi:MAG: ATP-binding protein [Syntrophobacter sp.]
MEIAVPHSTTHHEPAHWRKKHYASLYVRFILLTLICSVLPLLLVGWGIYVYYSEFASERMVEYFQSQVQHHERIIELFFKERVSDLQLIAYSQSLEQLKEQKNLQRIFDIMNRDGSFFEDVGVQNDQGKHLAYVGPFDLIDKDYSQTFWFKEVMARDVCISDMFLGYRKVPHVIVAVTNSEAGQKWILRATIYTDSFRSLLEDVKMGETGEVYLVNTHGILQTTPRFGGKILDKIDLPMGAFTDRSGIRILDATTNDDGRTVPRQIVAYTWLNDPKWMLVVKQDYSEVFQQVNRANQAMLIFLHISIIAILIVSIITTKHMIQVVKDRDEEADELNRQLVQTSKLASLGELAAGVAHEINNPLAIILTGNQVVRDLADEQTDLEAEFRSQLYECLAQADGQVLRCNMITHNLLRFARRSKSIIEQVNLNNCVGEVIELMEKRAKSSGVTFHRNFDEKLPQVRTDASQLQQVFVNLFANAIDAHEGKPYGAIHVTTRADGRKGGVEIAISDTGSGIPGHVLERMFDPFFTTKPVGKGTGLGLSISYNIIKNLGGEIRVQSSVGEGTEFIIFLPFTPPETLAGSSYERGV